MTVFLKGSRFDWFAWLCYPLLADAVTTLFWGQKASFSIDIRYCCVFWQNIYFVIICKLVFDFPWLFFLVFYRFTTASAKDHRQNHHPPGEHREGAIWRGVEGPLAWRRGGSEDLLLQRGALLVPWGGDLPDCHASSWEHPGIYCCRQQRSDNTESTSVASSFIVLYIICSLA